MAWPTPWYEDKVLCAIMQQYMAGNMDASQREALLAVHGARRRQDGSLWCWGGGSCVRITG